MSNKVVLQRKKLSAIFASFAILIIGTASLLVSMSIDYYSVLNTLGKVIPASIIIGGLGWIMGMILDKPKKRKTSYNNLFLGEMMKNDLTQSANEAESEA